MPSFHPFLVPRLSVRFGSSPCLRIASASRRSHCSSRFRTETLSGESKRGRGRQTSWQGAQHAKHGQMPAAMGLALGGHGEGVRDELQEAWAGRDKETVGKDRGLPNRLGFVPARRNAPGFLVPNCRHRSPCVSGFLLLSLTHPDTLEARKAWFLLFCRRLKPDPASTSCHDSTWRPVSCLAKHCRSSLNLVG